MNVKRQREISISPEDMKSTGVSAVFLFGSRAQGVSHERSDYDIGVLLVRPSDYFDDQTLNDIYRNLYDILSEAIGELVDIDIVFLDYASSELQMHVIRYGKILYTSDMRQVSRFRQRVMEDYADFEPHRRVFHEATFARIN